MLTGDLLADHPAAAVRLMILDRYWADGWDYTPALLDAAAARLENLYHAAGRATSARPDAVAEIRGLLGADLNVAAALDLAIETGGAPARIVATTLGLD